MRYVSKTESFENYVNRFNKIFNKDEKYIIFGSAFKAELVRKRVPNIQFYVDNDEKKVGGKIDGLEIKRPIVLKEAADAKIIVAVNEYTDVFEQLMLYGIPEENYCYFKEIIMIREYWDQRKFSFWDVSFIVTNRCTLSCKGCLEYVPYMHMKQKDFMFNEIICSVSDFFSYVGVCEVVRFMGGEVFLYPKLKELIQHLYEKYVFTEKVRKIVVTTNGTLIPEETVLEVLKKYDVLVEISDYRKAIQDKSKVDELIENFKREGISYSLTENYGGKDKQKWFDLGDPSKTHNMGEIELQQYYEKCVIDSCMTVWNSKMFNCPCVASSVMNLGRAEKDNDYCDLKTDNKIRFMKYFLGYNDKGYFDFCNYCNGYGKYLNKAEILPGEQ